MCGVIVVDAQSFRSTCHGRDAYILDHCLRYRHNFALFYQLLGSNLWREASSETYGPRVYFPSYKFPIYNFSLLFPLLCNLYFPFHKPKIPKVLLHRLSSLSDLTLQITVKGWTTPYRVGCKLVFICEGIQ